MDVLVDEVWPQIAPRRRRPGPAPPCADQEPVTMALVGECMGCDEETVFVSRWAEHRARFPRQPERSRFNRRRRLLARLDLAADRRCVLDSLPVPVVGWHLVPDGPQAYRECHEARIGDVASKKQWRFADKRSLLVNQAGAILDVVLAPANVPELQAGVEPLALPRRNHQRHPPAALYRPVNGARQIAETVNGQPAEQFKIEVNYALTFGGLAARLYPKPTAHVA